MKKALLTLSALALLTSPSLFAVEDSLQEHLKMEQKLKQQEQKRLKDGSGSGEKNQYKYQNQHEYKGTRSSRQNTGSTAGKRSGGGGRH